MASEGEIDPTVASDGDHPVAAYAGLVLRGPGCMAVGNFIEGAHAHERTRAGRCAARWLAVTA